MKALKILTVICAVFIFNNLTSVRAFGQETEKTTLPEKTKTEMSETEVDDDSETQINPKTQTKEKYRIGFQDTLQVDVFRHPELSLMVNVNPDGTILLPKIDQPISAVCKTERELGKTVEAHLKYYLKKPFVTVRAVDQRSQPFAVIGAVEKPGSFNLNRKIRLLELLAFAGGPDVEKAGANIQVARVGNVFGCVENADAIEEDVVFFSYKIKDVMDGKENPWMQPGDIVSVSDIEHAFVVGNVKEASKVPLKESVTLTQAIAFAGGLAKEAKTSKVRIQRQQSGSTVKTETFYDLKDIVSKKVPDPILQPNDIVEVPKDGVKAVRNGVLKAISGGLGGLFMRF